MKKHFLLVWLLSIVGYTYAEFRSAEEALLIANEQSSVRKSGSMGVKHPYRVAFVCNQVDNVTPAFYVLQRDENDGFMLVSAETKSTTILGYSETGSFDIEKAPANVKFWMDRYARQISILSKSSYVQPKKLASSYTPISPIIGSLWGQEDPYNLKCPKVGTASTVAGCVATAISQIMFYHKHPTMGTGSHSYSWNSQTLSADFANTTYDWGNMLKEYTSTSTKAQKNAVATLVYHVGVASEMNYSTGGSGANSNNAVNALLTYFGYDPAIRVYKLDYAGGKVTQAAIVKELQEGRPVLFSGRTVSNEGHAFVCEGVDENGLLYINWGWYGYQDGYFVLTLLDPTDQGTGGSASDEAYTEEVAVFTGIRPNQDGAAIPYVTASEATLYSKYRIKKNTTTGWSMSLLGNSGVCDWNTTVYLLVVKADGTIVAQKSKTISDGVLSPGYYYSSKISVTGSFSTLAAGEYYLGGFVVDNNKSAWPIQVLNKGDLLVPMQVTSDSIFIGELTDLPEWDAPVKNPEKGLEYSHFRAINTYGTTKWSLDLTTPLFWSTSSQKNDKLIRCNLVSSSGNSLVGSYVLSTSGEEGTIASDAFYAYGYYASCYQYTPSQMQFTFTTEGEKVVVDYYYEYSTNKGAGQAVIDKKEQDWWQLISGNNYYHQSLTQEVTTPLSVNAAKTIGNACTDSTYIPFLIKGLVSSDVTLSKGKLSFSISDDGTNNNTLKINRFLWLEKAAATASCGLRKGDMVVLYGKIRKASTQISCSDGYIYEHTATNVTALSDHSQPTSSANKVLEDGHVKIVRDGKTYNVLGYQVQ